jgi:predicted phosphodiesterase
MLGGDVFSGNLHDLAQTNADTLPGSVLHWSEHLCSAITVLAEHFGKVHVAAVVGNHGRLTLKPRTKLRARDNVDWLVAHMVARHFEVVDGVTVSVTDDPDAFVQVYDTTHLLTHGDQVSGGGGIGGIWPPIMRMIARKRSRYAQQPFDVVCMGHWHQLIMAPTQGLIVNGSLKGYDEFAALCNFAPEPPQQALWMVTPEHKVTWSAPVFVGDRKREGW